MPQDLLQLGALAVIFFFAVKEFFSYLKSRNNKPENLTKEIFTELQVMNNNHLNSIKEAIEKGNDRLIVALNSHSINEHMDSMKIIELLGEINGKLSRR